MPQQADPSAPDTFYGRATELQATGRYEEAVQLLWQGVQHGEVSAMTLLGAQLISGRGAPPDPGRGAQLMLEAAHRGGAYACAVASALVAKGFFGPKDWERALDYLQRSAELGYVVAQDQLKVLARGPGEAPADPTVWSSLRRSIDLKAWRFSRPARSLTEDRAIRVVQGFADPDVCEWIVARAQGRLGPALVFSPAAGRPIRDPDRTGGVAGFDLLSLDLVVLLVMDRLAEACGAPIAALEPTNVLHYAVGQQFVPHYDFLDPNLAGTAQDLARLGQRTRTMLIYLNEGFEGGETDFPLLGVPFKGRLGDLLIFDNVDGAGAPDRRMLHAGLPPTAGEKWVLSQWVRDHAPAVG